MDTPVVRSRQAAERGGGACLTTWENLSNENNAYCPNYKDVHKMLQKQDILLIKTPWPVPKASRIDYSTNCSYTQVIYVVVIAQ